ncbi:hypothetical protein [Thiopseudomonas acetoxidans]|uniref:Uncharacterized protein n=1 Tax=Thiopseudomonas acetoxidans TaxID=3041622 RepID=A0ABT7SQ57_9GAMM|nr:hypothetical protein [Thiopseudomonas sp. CY1220]MDM7858322.1 hypothetical protein [Thiopseudomonas sp. CY1220]
MLQSIKWKTICALIFVSVLAAWLLLGSNPLANANAGQLILQQHIEQLADVKQTTTE